jgi:hypothetical protein
VSLDELRWLGAETAGVVHLDQARAAGLSDRNLDRLVAGGRWQRVHPRVYATYSGPLTVAARRYAAVMYAGKDAALSHWTAADRLGFGRPSAAVHVIVPIVRRVHQQPGLVIHRSRTLAPAEIRMGPPPYTSVERTVTDLLPEMASADAAIGLVADAVRSRRSSAERLRRAVGSGPTTLRWRGVILDVLPDVERGAESPLEVRDARIRRTHGLPQGSRQVTRGAEGSEHLDVVIEEYGVHVELDGRLGHDHATEIWRDMDRDNRSELQRLRHLRYGWADLVGRPCRVAIQQATVLGQQGWPGPFRPCRICPSALSRELCTLAHLPR